MSNSILSPCEGGIQLEMFSSKLSFPRSKAVCENEGGHLVIMENQAKYDRVTQFYRETGLPDSARYWIGLEATDFSRGERDPLRFFWVNGNLDQSFYEIPNAFPWRSNSRPNNTGGQDCVAIRTSAQTFEDLSCSTSDVRFMCEYSCTAEPTNNPTTFPTPPTKQPTPLPTPPPVENPTPKPTTGVPTPFPVTESPTTAFDPTERVGADTNSVFGFGMPIGGELGILMALFFLACFSAYVTRALVFKDRHDYDEDDEAFVAKVKEEADKQLAVTQTI